MAAQALYAWPRARRGWLRARGVHGRGRGAARLSHVGRVGRVGCVAHMLPAPLYLQLLFVIVYARGMHAHFTHTRRLRPATRTRRFRPAFRLRPPIQLRLANISLQLSNCATRQYQPQKANTQQEHSTTKHTAAHTKRYQATPGTHRITRSRSKRSLRLSPSAPPFPIPRKNGSGAS